jgi:predicted transcriptional regulator
MSVLSLRLPDSLHAKARELAEREDISLNQFIALAVAEKMSALLTSEYLDERASRGARDTFRGVLARVADVEPAAGDELPKTRRKAPAAPARRPARRPSR